MTRRFSVVSFVILLVVASVTPAAIAGLAQAAPQGFVGVPDEAVTEDLPSDYGGDLGAEDLRGRTLASDHAGTLDVIVTTPDRASKHVENGSVLGGERTDVAIVLRDDVESAGREVALDAKAMRAAFGYLPTRVWGTSENGSTWSSTTRVEDGYLIFEVPHFSTQTVTFSSEITLSGDPAVDGTGYSYEIENLDSATDPDVRFTGVTTSETETIYGSATSGTVDANIAGTVDPGTTTVTLTGNGFGSRWDNVSHAGVADGHSGSITVDGPLSDTSEAEAPTVTITGQTTTESESALWNGLADGDSTTIDVAGNTAPSGQSVTFEGEESVFSESRSGTGVTGGDSVTLSTGGDEAPRNEEIVITGSSSTSSLDTSGNGVAAGSTHAVGVSGDNLDPTGPSANGQPTLTLTGYSELSATNEQIEDPASEDADETRDGGVQINPNKDAGAVRVRVRNSNADTLYLRDSSGNLLAEKYIGPSAGSWVRINYDVNAGTTYLVGVGAGGSQYSEYYTTDQNYPYTGSDVDVTGGYMGDSSNLYTTQSGAFNVDAVGLVFHPDATVEADDGTAVSFTLNDGETVTKEFDITESATQLTINSPAGTFDYAVDGTARTATVDPSVDVDGDGTAEASHSGILTEGETVTFSGINFAAGSETVDFGGSGAAYDWSASWDRVEHTEDPSVDVDGDGTAEASVSGTIAPGETVTKSVWGLSPGSNALSVSTASGTTTGLSVSWTEQTQTEDPSVTLDGVTKSHSGKLTDGETVTLSWAPSDLTAEAANGYSLSLASTPSGSPGMIADYSIAVNEVAAAKNPSVDVDGDGTAEASFSGLLTAGETRNYSVDLTTENDNWAVESTGSPITVSAEITEKTIPEDPGVEVNGQNFRTNGTLNGGENASLTVPASALEEGQNNVSVLVGYESLSADAPAPTVAFNYSHRVDSKKSVSISASKWSEEINVSRYFPDDREDATVEVDFAGNVAAIGDLEIRKGDSASWQTLDSDAYSLDGTTLTAQIGEIPGGTNVTVSGTGQKVKPINGAFEIVEPTVAGDDLDTKIEVTNVSDGFGIMVGPAGTPVHYAANPSWSDESHAEIRSDGDQFLALPAANVGSTARIRTAPIVVEPEGEIEVVVYDVDDTPKFALRTGSTAGADRVEVKYLDAVDGDDYQLFSITNDRGVVSQEADGSTVIFATDGSSQTYEVRLAPSGTSSAVVSVGGGGGEGGGGGGASPFAIIALFAGMAGAIGGVWFLGRRFGASGPRQNTLLIAVGAVVGVVGVEAVTGRSIVSDVIFSVGAATSGSPVGSVIAGVAILLGIYLLDQRLGLPTWLKLAVGVLTGIYVVDGLSGGALTAALGEIGPLVWLIVLGGSILLLWRALKGPTFKIVGRGS